MKESKIQNLLSVASASKQWHFHMLGKNCIFNKHKGAYMLVLEEKDGVLFSLSNEKPLSASKKLADMMYGKLAMGESKESEAFASILKKAKEYSEKHIDWHHHHLVPGCMFSKEKNKHFIILEQEDGTVLTAAYKEKPSGDIARIEKLFYKSLNNQGP